MTERIKRLGIPFAVYSFLLQPYIGTGFDALFFGVLLPLLNIAYTVMTSITHNIITATTASSTNSDTNNNGRNSHTNNNDNMNQQSNNNTIIHNSNHDGDVDGATTTTANNNNNNNNNTMTNNTKIIIPCPTLCQVFVVSLIIGLISAITMLFVPPMSFVMTIPLLWELGPSYVFFFFIGGIAQQNNWLHTIQLK